VKQYTMPVWDQRRGPRSPFQALFRDAEIRSGSPVPIAIRKVAMIRRDITPSTETRIFS
jgi:hypothetical protein